MTATILAAAANEMTKGAAKMMEMDPHGWTLTLVSVGVVFTGLVILFFVYSASGNLFSGKWKLPKRKPRKASGTAAVPDEEVAAAIAMALQAMGGEDEVAIALALHLYLSDCIHDAEPGIITIRQTAPAAWADKKLTFRKKA